MLVCFPQLRSCTYATLRINPGTAPPRQSTICTAHPQQAIGYWVYTVPMHDIVHVGLIEIGLHSNSINPFTVMQIPNQHAAAISLLLSMIASCLQGCSPAHPVYWVMARAVQLLQLTLHIRPIMAHEDVLLLRCINDRYTVKHSSSKLAIVSRQGRLTGSVSRWMCLTGTRASGTAG
jgi:hypothetical protein